MSEIILTQSYNGRMIQLPIGYIILIKLPENPTTGYRWNLEEVNETIICRLDPQDTDFSIAHDSGIGGGGIRTFRFKTISAGQSIIVLKLRRSWEHQDAAIDLFSVIIDVK